VKRPTRITQTGRRRLTLLDRRIALINNGWWPTHIKRKSHQYRKERSTYESNE